LSAAADQWADSQSLWIFISFQAAWLWPTQPQPTLAWARSRCRRL